tara:strand:+ start:282 stop:836 length:555 start_codon:yes stop_codon:yes gene_type:complete
MSTDSRGPEARSSDYPDTWINPNPTTEEKLEAVKNWSQIRRRKFPLWELNEIINEAWIQLDRLMGRYDSSRGPLLTFVRSSLWSPVSNAYFRMNGIVVLKRKGQKHQREYLNPAIVLCETDDWIAEDTREVIEIPEIKSKTLQRTALLLARGFNQKQIADIDGVTEAAVSKRVDQLRKVLHAVS